MYTIKEVAELLKMHPITIYRFVESGQLKAIKVGRSWRIRDEDINNIIYSENKKV